MITVKGLIDSLQAMLDAKMIQADRAIDVHDVGRDDLLRVCGYEIFETGDVYLKAISREEE